jgi:hypothetical protein
MKSAKDSFFFIVFPPQWAMPDPSDAKNGK